MPLPRIYNPDTKRMEVVLPPAPPPAPVVPKPPKPTVTKMASNLVEVAISTSKLIISGQKPLATDEVVAERLGICKVCDNWDASGYRGLGKCIACGCSGFKVKVAASKCPLNRWQR